MELDFSKTIKETKKEKSQDNGSLNNAFDNLEVQKHLYNTNLQNIFNDYQKHYETLDNEKQKQVQEAYYTRELSKKYLGEYASNMGIGDISGGLLDIYGKYQANINEINANFDKLKYGLTEKYNEKKNYYQLGLQQANEQQRLIELEKQRQSDIAQIQSNIATGIYPNKMNLEQYLDSVRGKIGEQAYWNLMTKNKVMQLNEQADEALKNSINYKTKEEYDKYIDGLFNENKINEKQAKYLKEMYIYQNKTNFGLNNSINIEGDILDYNTDTSNIKSKGNVYESRDKSEVLAETNNKIDSTNNIYAELSEKSKNIDYNTPFAHNGKFFVKNIENGEQVFIEYKKSTNYNKLTYNNEIDKNNGLYEQLNKELGEKDGNIKTPNGTIHFKYDKEKGTYSQYLNFQAFGHGKNSWYGDYNINGVYYKYNWNKDATKNEEVLKEFAKIYFNGNLQETKDFVKNNRIYNDSVNAKVIVLNKKFYAINGYKIYELERGKQR